jgi:hypothetical protein
MKNDNNLLSKFSKEEKNDLENIKLQIKVIAETYANEYEALAKISEDLDNQKQVLKKKYEILDSKTGLNTLYLKVNKLYEKPPNEEN